MKGGLHEDNGGGDDAHQTAFEIGVIVPKRVVGQTDDDTLDCVEVIVSEFRKIGFVVDRVLGLHDEFIKGWIYSLSGMRLKLLSGNLMVRCSVGASVTDAIIT